MRKINLVFKNMNYGSMDIGTIGKKIRLIRLAKNLKLETVAELVSMSTTGYGNIERGHTKHLTMKRIAIIAHALGISTIELLQYQEDNYVSRKTHDEIIEGYKLCNDQKDKEIQHLKRLLDECGAKYK